MRTVKLMAFAAVVVAVSNVGCGSKERGPNYDDQIDAAGGVKPALDATSASEAANEASTATGVDAEVAEVGQPLPEAATAQPVDAGADATTTVAQPDAADVPVSCADAGTCHFTVTPQASAIPADGKATVAVDISFFPSAIGDSVQLTITGRGSWNSNKSKQITVALDPSGKASALFLSDAAGGTATISAIRVGHAETATAKIDMPVLADILVSPQYSLMGVRSSGFQEANVLTFKVMDSDGPYPAGLQVAITHKPLGKSTIGELPTCTGTDCVITDTGTTDQNGEVKVVLRSGNSAGTAIVSLAATAGGQTKIVPGSSNIVGAKASGKNIAVDCTPRNVPALLDTDCNVSRVDSPVQCTMTLGDRFKNIIGIEAKVAFLSEAGTAPLPQSTPVFPDPKIGFATGVITTIGGALPVDVPPLSGERSLTYPDVCHPSGSGSVHNPRDGVVAVIATVKGEEGFIDVNGDGDFNTGEPFMDLAEPFVDANDNNVQDENEAFLDLNNNGRWDGPNGAWDSSTTLWAQTRIMYSGGGAVLHDASGKDLLSRFTTSARVVPMAPSKMPDIVMSSGDVRDIGFFVCDYNLNVLAPTTVYAASASTPAVSVTKADYMAPTRTEGFFFGQQFCDGDAPTLCDTKCQIAASTKRCIIQTAPSAFEYGVAGSIHLLATQSGSFNLDATATVSGATLLIEVPGTVLPAPP